MILTFFFVFVFLWGYLKLFPHPNKLKMIVVVAVFSILVSFLVSFVTVSRVYWSLNPAPSQFSLPFHFKIDWGLIYAALNTGKGWFRIFFADVQLLEMQFRYRSTGAETYIYQPGHIDIDITLHVLSQLVLIFTALNIIGAPLAALAYKLTITSYKPTQKLAKKLTSRIARFT